MTKRAQEVMRLAEAEAQRLNHDRLATEHVLLGLVRQGESTAAEVLKSLNIDLKRIRAAVETTVQPGRPSAHPPADLDFTPRAKRVIQLAWQEARQLGANYIGTEHLLLGLVHESEGVAAMVLAGLGLKLQHVRQEVLSRMTQRDVARAASIRKPPDQR